MEPFVVRTNVYKILYIFLERDYNSFLFGVVFTCRISQTGLTQGRLVSWMISHTIITNFTESFGNLISPFDHNKYENIVQCISMQMRYAYMYVYHVNLVCMQNETIAKCEMYSEFYLQASSIEPVKDDCLFAL